MLSELKMLHANLSAQIDELERLTAEPVPRASEIAATRLKLTRASRQRTNFLDQVVYPALLREGAIAYTRPVQALRDDDKNRLVISARHIGAWTLPKILEHWDDYRAASQTMRLAMRERIKEEQTVLYALLAE